MEFLGPQFLLWLRGGDGSGDVRIVFGENQLWRDRVQFVRNLAKEVMSANEVENGGMDCGSSVTRMIGWTPLRVGSLTLTGPLMGTRDLCLQGECCVMVRVSGVTVLLLI